MLEPVFMNHDISTCSKLSNLEMSCSSGLLASAQTLYGRIRKVHAVLVYGTFAL